MRKRHLAILAAALTVAVSASLALGYREVTKPDPRLIAIFDAGVPGTPEATAALDFAASAGIDLVINYSVINAAPAAVDAYLDHAHHVGVKVAVSVKDLLARPDMTVDLPDLDPELTVMHGKYPADLDPANAELHQQYGPDTDTQVENIIRRFDGKPAVWGYYANDETPETVDGLHLWLPAIQARLAQIRSLTQKPVLSSFELNPASFIKQVAGAGNHAMLDYYPYPNGAGPDGQPQHYGSIADIPRIAGDVHAAAGDQSWFALQGFSYYTSEPDMIAAFNFPADPPPTSNHGAPRAKMMVTMANLALQGGACNLAIFSYPYAAAIPGQLREIEIAVRQIRELHSFQC